MVLWKRPINFDAALINYKTLYKNLFIPKYNFFYKFLNAFIIHFLDIPLHQFVLKYINDNLVLLPFQNTCRSQPLHTC